MNNITHSAQESKNRVVTVSLRKEAYNKLQELANENERSKSYFLKKALDNYLEDLYLYKKAIAVLEKDEPIYDLKDMAKEYGLSDQI
jgi:RHH-type rel operon transcriptional repressor/antitoxin RelB